MRGLRRPAAVLATLLLGAFLVGAIFAPALARFDPDRQDTRRVLEPPGPLHRLGTDRLGRDVWARLLYGSRVSMAVGAAASLLSLLLGGTYGALSGMAGGASDLLLMRGVEVASAMPALVVIVLLREVFEAAGGSGVGSLVVALALMGWPDVSRIVRGEVIRVRGLAFIEAAEATGRGRAGIFLAHVLPHLAGPLLVVVTFNAADAILSESTLSFLGIGLRPPAASWGSLANEGWEAARFHPHLILAPSLAAALTLVALQVVGDALKDLFEPRR